MSLIFLIILIFFNLVNPKNVFAKNENPYWEIQSVDTMKLSRDLAREKINDPTFELKIAKEIKKIADLGATHVAFGTPYDEEFIPFMEKWVKEARKNDLNVWFRGNFSGWEGWFNYSRISSEEHTKKLEHFILLNQDLFEDGDIFTPCPECENGGTGDPRHTGNVQEFRDFLISEYEISTKSFKHISKDVKAGYFSMNADVARLVMDKETTQKLGGIVVIDHYVRAPEILAQDIEEIATSTGGKVILGEIGVPIPDIHGNINEQAQAGWMEAAFELLVKEKSLIGINYWTATGGSTALWYSNGDRKPIVDVVEKYFSPEIINGNIKNEINRPIRNALIIADSKETYSDSEGNFEIAVHPNLSKIIIKADGYKEKSVEVEGGSLAVILEKENESILFKLEKYMAFLLRRLDNLTR